MSGYDTPTLQQRIAAVRDKLAIDRVIERYIKLSGSSGAGSRRGKCPFHQGNSASFVVRSAHRTAKCFGCQWPGDRGAGDVIRFVQDQLGLSFIDALAECEAEAGTASGAVRTAAGSGPVRRERNPLTPARARSWNPVEPIDMGRWIWKHAARDDGAARRYFCGRGVPEAVLTAARLGAFRYLGECPAALWAVGEDPRGGGSKRVIHNPALVALVTEPRLLGNPEALAWVAVGVHVTYLNPAGDGTMVRRKPWARPDDPHPLLPKRRMLGPVGRGCVVLGDYHAAAHLWVGEGNETVLSAMALAAASPDAVGIATLSLDNLQGFPGKWKGGIWPLHAIAPSPERGPFIVPGHRGPVTGLVDSDMSPLRGIRDPQTGTPRGEPVVERKGGPIVHRALTGAERARICGELLVKGWRAAGVHDVTAMRAPAGLDFNDVLCLVDRADVRPAGSMPPVSEAEDAAA